MGPTWGPPGSCRPQMGPALAPWILLSEMLSSAPISAEPCYQNYPQYTSNANMTVLHWVWNDIPDSQVHGANMGPIWGRQDPGGPHVGPMKLAIWHDLHIPCQLTKYCAMKIFVYIFVYTCKELVFGIHADLLIQNVHHYLNCRLIFVM